MSKPDQFPGGSTPDLDSVGAFDPRAPFSEEELRMLQEFAERNSISMDTIFSMSDPADPGNVRTNRSFLDIMAAIESGEATITNPYAEIPDLH
jgi:hypothetical protein